MFSLLVQFLKPQDVQDQGADPRGGRVPVLQAPWYNNLHVPYRGQATDFNAPHRDPQGVPLSYIQSMPGLDTQLNNASLNAALAGLRKKQNDPGGQNVQRYYPGYSFGVGRDG